MATNPTQQSAIDEIASRRAELVFAFVAPIGVDANRVSTTLQSQLKEFGYESHAVRLSDQFEYLAKELGLDIDLGYKNEIERVKKYMAAGNSLCEAAGRNDLFALSAIRDIAERPNETPQPGIAHIISSLKRPEEIEKLRQVYGPGLFVIGAFAAEEDRVKFLKADKQSTEDEAKKLIEIDRNDGRTGGQRTGDAFHLADVFIDVGKHEKNWTYQITRFLDLIFSHPYHTPTPDEYAMYMAYGAGLRSAQLGRQVGASIFCPSGELLAVGCNEVPKPTGGQYWVDDDPDERDHIRKIDSNDAQKAIILEEILQALPSNLRTQAIRDDLRKTSLFSITEFGRAVHAEMEAIISCARKGVSLRGAKLYTTTFPCHNCARHIVAAGLSRVVYIEPYSKSRATELHDDSIHASNSSDVHNKIPFLSFVGIAPRRYAELFSTRPLFGPEISRKLKNGQAIPWERGKSILRSPMRPLSYVEREQSSINEMRKVIDSKAKQRRIF